MKYRNASDILPDSLLRELQKYVSGEVVYVPSEKRSGWGNKTGASTYYSRRNEEIRERHAAGTGIDTLADEYNLSTDTIRKIVYKQVL